MFVNMYYNKKYFDWNDVDIKCLWNIIYNVESKLKVIYVYLKSMEIFFIEW